MSETPALFGFQKTIKIKSKIKSVEGLGLLPGDKLVVADRMSHDIKLYSREGKFEQKLVSGVSSSGLVTNRSGLVVVSCNQGKRSSVRLYSQHGDLVNEWGTDRLWTPTGVAVNNRGQIIVTDVSEHKHSVGLYTNDGSPLLRFGSKGTGPKEFNKPTFVTSDVYDRIIVSDTNNDCVKVFDREGKPLVTVGAKNSGPGQLRRPQGITADAQGNILVCDAGNQRVAVFTSSGRYIQNLLNKEDEVGSPRTICFSREGKLIIGSTNSVSGDFRKIRIYEISQQ